MKYFTAFCTVVLIFLWGCSAEKIESPVYDFILNLTEADQGIDQCIVDLSKPDDFRFLGDGWHVPGTNGIPISRFVWSSKNSCEVFFEVKTAGEKELLVTVRPYQFEGIQIGSLDFEINGQELGRIKLIEDWRTYRLIVPERMIIVGEQNRVVIRQPILYSPSDVTEYDEDSRQLGSSYSYFILRDIQSPRPPDMYTVQQALGAKNFLWGGLQRHVLYKPAPAVFTWTVELPSHPVLSFGAGYMPEGYDINGGSAAFRVSLKDEAGREHELFNTQIPPPRRLLEMGWDEYSRDLSDFAHETVSITFETPLNTPEKGEPNSGSWLEPMLLNKHVPINVVFIPGYFNYPPEKPLPGSVHEKFAFISGKTLPVPIESIKKQSDNGLPDHFMEVLAGEGWQTGYYYAGLDPVTVETDYGRKFDSVVGYETASDETLEELFEECTSWIKRVDGQAFALTINPVIEPGNTDQSIEFLDYMLNWFFDFQFNRDSFIVLFNPEDEQRVWILNPGEQEQTQLEMNSWDDVELFIKNELSIGKN